MMMPRRSWLVTVLAILFLLLSILGWLRFQQALVFWGTLTRLDAWPGPLYVALGGVIWGLVGLPAAWGVWRRMRWAPGAARVAALVYPVTYWTDRVWFSPGAGVFTNWPFALVVTLIWLIFVFAITARPSNVNPEQGRK